MTRPLFIAFSWFLLTLACEVDGQISRVTTDEFNLAQGTNEGRLFDIVMSGKYNAKVIIAYCAQTVVQALYDSSKPPIATLPYSTLILDVYQRMPTITAFQLFPSRRTVYILFSAKHLAYIRGSKDAVARYVVGELIQQVARVMLYDGRGEAPEGLLTGIAAYIRLKAGFADPDWNEPGVGPGWDQGDGGTAYFLRYLFEQRGVVTPRRQTLASLNAFLEYMYNDQMWAVKFGKTAEDLWLEFQQFLWRQRQNRG